MILKHNDKEYELKFTYNSFKLMKNLDLGELELIESQPFRILEFTEQLLLGAINNNPRNKVGIDIVSEIVESKMESEELVEFMDTLIKLLEDSSFFKNLQK